MFLINKKWISMPFFAFYLLVFCNFTPEIIGCRLQTILKTNMIVKYIIGFILLFFLIVNPENADQKQFYYCYFDIWMVLFIYKNTYYYILVILTMLLLTYILGVRETRMKKENRHEDAKNTRRIKILITQLALVVTLIGFVS